jgi:hypothetical protein
MFELFVDVNVGDRHPDDDDVPGFGGCGEAWSKVRRRFITRTVCVSMCTPTWRTILVKNDAWWWWCSFERSGCGWIMHFAFSKH